MKVTLTKISRGQKDTKFGPRNSIGIKVAESVVYDVGGGAVNVGDRWFNGLFDVAKPSGTENWKEGDVVEVDIVTKGDFLNYRPAKIVKAAHTNSAVEELSKKVDMIMKHLNLSADVPQAVDPNDF